MYCLVIIWEKYLSWFNSKIFLLNVIMLFFQEGLFEDWIKDRLIVQVGEENYYFEYEIKIQVYNVMGKGLNFIEVVVYLVEGSKYQIIIVVWDNFEIFINGIFLVCVVIVYFCNYWVFGFFFFSVNSCFIRIIL